MAAADIPAANFVFLPKGSDLYRETPERFRDVNTKDLENKKIWMTRPRKNDPDAIKKAGRVHALVFHPSRAQLVGFLVKRPDIALMFRREDMFVAYNGFVQFENYIVIREEPEAKGRGALRALGVDLDDCVIWLGLPVMTKSGRSLGIADGVEFDEDTGRVVWLETSNGATANTLLGRRRIPGELVKGFRRGIGVRLRSNDAAVEGDESDCRGRDADNDRDASPEQEESLGAIIVAEQAAELPVEGGVAEKAGAATAVAADKAQKTYKKVVKKVKPVASEAAETAGKAVKQGAYVTGRQIARTEGMFKNFKDEFKKAMNDDGE